MSTRSATTPAASPADAAALSKQVEFAAHARLSEHGLRALDDLQRAGSRSLKLLPLPATFLVDGKGGTRRHL
jgi:hypothetical protein